MSDKKKKYPQCFGQLDKVFPIGNDRLRHTPQDCLECRDKTECLRSAVKGDEGIKVHEEKVDRAYDSGTIGFFERWSRKKNLHRRKKNGKAS